MTAWTFRDLQADQLDLVREAERTMSADIVLAYAPVPDGPLHDGDDAVGMAPATLSESELECLQGLESRLDTVLVAYHRPTS